MSGTRLWRGVLASMTARATSAEKALSGDVDDASARAAAKGVGATVDPPSDVHASAEYRRSLAETSIVRAVLQANERARG